jgi:phosphate starvation-inducible protein PhoH and related proteins
VRGILDKVDDIAFCNLTNHDVVRHKLVGRIVAAYDKFEASHTDALRTESAASAPPPRPVARRWQ